VLSPPLDPAARVFAQNTRSRIFIFNINIESISFTSTSLFQITCNDSSLRRTIPQDQSHAFPGLPRVRSVAVRL
jgi:hypothetical protein